MRENLKGFTMKKSYNYSLRFVLMPGVEEEKRINDLVAFCQKSKIDDVIFFIAAEDFYAGHITKEMAKPYVEAIKKAKIQLEKIGVTTSLNPWCTLAHGDRGRKQLKGQNFKTMVGENGTVADTVVCPLCEAWHTYYIDYLKYLIEEIQPHTVWLEDDFRMAHHFPDDGSPCFCEDHLKLYAKALGIEKISREEMVKGLRENKKGYRKVYADVNGEAMLTVLEKIVEGVGKSGARIALMTSSGEQYLLEGRDARKFFDTLSKYTPSANRLGLRSYRQRPSHLYSYIFNRFITLSRALVRDDLTIYSEIENAPMSRYCKSARWTAFQMLMTSPLLFEGATFDIFEFNGNGITDATLFAENLAAVKPFLQKMLSLSLRYTQLSGVNIAILPNRYEGMGRKDMVIDVNENDNLMGAVLSMLGHSVCYTQDPMQGDVVALLPTTASILTAEQIEKIFAEKFVILPADTVQVLMERGFSSLLHIHSTEKLLERTGKHTYEQIAKAGIVEDEKYRASCQLFVGHYLKAEYEEGYAEALTKVYNYDNSLVGNGITLVGDNVLIFPYFDAKECHEQEMPFGLFHDLRGKALGYAIFHSKKSGDCFFCKNCMIIPYFYKTEEKDYAILCNYLEDGAEKLVFTAKENYSKISVIFEENPKEVPVNFEKVGEEYRVDCKMGASTAIILVLEK